MKTILRSKSLLIKISKLLLIPSSSKSSNFISINFEEASKVIFFKDLGCNKQSKLNYSKLTSRINENINPKFKFKDVFEIVEFSKKETDIEDLVTNYIVNFILNNKEIDINKIAILTLNNSQCLDFKKKLNPVSYTHLTLPTNLSV